MIITINIYKKIYKLYRISYFIYDYNTYNLFLV